MMGRGGQDTRKEGGWMGSGEGRQVTPLLDMGDVDD